MYAEGLLPRVTDIITGRLFKDVLRETCYV